MVKKNRKNDDISNTTVAIMLGLLIVVSIVGLGMYVHSLDSINLESVIYGESPVAQGEVSFTATTPEEGAKHGPNGGLTPTANGDVTFKVTE